MPTLDRRPLAWSDDSDAEDDDLTTSASWGLAVDAGSYDRCAAAFIDDVLVPGTANGRAAGRTLMDGLDSGGGVSARPSSGTRKACAVAGLVAVGCVSAYLVWRGGTSKLPVLS